MRSFVWEPAPARTRSALGIVVAAVVAFATLGLASPAQAACGDPVDVQVDQEACANTLAVSVTGGAKSSGTCTGEVSCIAVSGTGSSKTGTASDAGAPAQSQCGGVPLSGGLLSGELHAGVGCIAVSGTGSAENASSGGGSCGHASNFTTGVGCIAVSGAGDASNTSSGGSSCGSGTSSITLACVAVSGGGDASNSASADNNCDYASSALAVGCIAVSGMGNASNTVQGSCGFHTFGFGSLAARATCVAVSGTGSASNTVGGSCAQALSPQVSVGCMAVSGTGNASNSVGGSCGSGTTPTVEGFSDWVTGVINDPLMVLPFIGGWPPTGGLAVGCLTVDGQDPVEAHISGSHGCVVAAGYYCTFVGNGAFAPNGVVSATSGSWAITHQEGATTLTDVAGSGPNALPFPFAAGVLYTLTVGADGAGVVAAGSPT